MLGVALWQRPALELDECDSWLEVVMRTVLRPAQ